jgi:hypothetical protein
LAIVMFVLKIIFAGLTLEPLIVVVVLLTEDLLTSTRQTNPLPSS